MDWHTNSTPLPKELDTNDCKTTIRNVNGTDSADLNQFCYNGSFSYFDRLCFDVQTGKKQTPFIVFNLNALHTGVFTYQPNNDDWINGPGSSQSSCSDYVDKDS